MKKTIALLLALVLTVGLLASCAKKPGDEATAAFAQELAAFEVSKGTIRLPYNRPLPTELIGRIARWCYEKYAR